MTRYASLENVTKYLLALEDSNFHDGLTCRSVSMCRRARLRSCCARVHAYTRAYAPACLRACVRSWMHADMPACMSAVGRLSVPCQVVRGCYCSLASVRCASTVHSCVRASVRACRACKNG